MSAPLLPRMSFGGDPIMDTVEELVAVSDPGEIGREDHNRGDRFVSPGLKYCGMAVSDSDAGDYRASYIAQ